MLGEQRGDSQALDVDNDAVADIYLGPQLLQTSFGLILR